MKSLKSCRVENSFWIAPDVQTSDESSSFNDFKIHLSLLIDFTSFFVFYDLLVEKEKARVRVDTKSSLN